MINFIIKKIFDEENIEEKKLQRILDFLQKREWNLFEKSIKNYNDQNMIQLLLGLQCFSQNNFIKGEKYLIPLLHIKEYDSYSFLVLGFLYYEQHAYTNSMKALKNYMRRNPSHLDVGIFICELFIKGKDNKQAHICLLQILNSKYIDLMACMNSAKYFFRLKDGENGYKALTRAFVISNPTVEEAASILDVAVQAGAYKIADELFSLLYNHRYKNNNKLFYYYANCYKNKKKYYESLTYFFQIIEKQPKKSGAYNGIGAIYLEQKEFAKAIEYFTKAIEVNKENIKLYNDLSVAYSQNEQYTKAIENSLYSIEIEKNVSAYSNLALDYYKIRDFSKAEKANEEALKLEPYNVSVHFNQSLIYLIQNKFKKGFFHYDLRFNSSAKERLRLPLGGVSLWNGESLVNKTLFIYDEQGNGDIIVFARMLKLLKPLVKKIIFYVRKELLPLFEHNELFEGIILISKDIDPTIEYKEFDYQIPIMSLPSRLNVTINIIKSTAKTYLFASTQTINKWEEILNEKCTKKLRVALTWSGNPNYAYDKYRSIKIEQIKDLVLNNPQIDFIALTKGNEADKLRTEHKDLPIIHIDDNLDSFDDTAGLLHHIDLVISVDTAVSHLAAAMGKPTWVLLYHIPFWIWGTKEKSIWYKSAKTYRQEVALEWDDIINQIDEDLKLFIKKVL